MDTDLIQFNSISISAFVEPPMIADETQTLIGVISVIRGQVTRQCTGRRLGVHSDARQS